MTPFCRQQQAAAVWRLSFLILLLTSLGRGWKKDVWRWAIRYNDYLNELSLLYLLWPKVSVISVHRGSFNVRGTETGDERREEWNEWLMMRMKKSISFDVTWLTHKRRLLGWHSWLSNSVMNLTPRNECVLPFVSKKYYHSSMYYYSLLLFITSGVTSGSR
jgi:hypothetical protein